MAKSSFCEALCIANRALDVIQSHDRSANGVSFLYAVKLLRVDHLPLAAAMAYPVKKSVAAADAGRGLNTRRRKSIHLRRRSTLPRAASRHPSLIDHFHLSLTGRGWMRGIARGVQLEERGFTIEPDLKKIPGANTPRDEYCRVRPATLIQTSDLSTPKKSIAW